MAELTRYTDPRVIVNSQVKRDPIDIETGANKLLRATI